MFGLQLAWECMFLRALRCIYVLPDRSGKNFDGFRHRLLPFEFGKTLQALTSRPTRCSASGICSALCMEEISLQYIPYNSINYKMLGILSGARYPSCTVVPSNNYWVLRGHHQCGRGHNVCVTAGYPAGIYNDQISRHGWGTAVDCIMHEGLHAESEKTEKGEFCRDVFQVTSSKLRMKVPNTCVLWSLG